MIAQSGRDVTEGTQWSISSAKSGFSIFWRILVWLGRTMYWSIFQITIPFLFWIAWSFFYTIGMMIRLSYSLLLGRGHAISSPPNHHHQHKMYPSRSYEKASDIPWMSSPQSKTYSEDTGSTCSTSSSTRVSSLATSKPPSIAPEETRVASTSQTLVDVTGTSSKGDNDHGNRSRSNSIHSSSPHDHEDKDFDYLWESLLPAHDNDTSESNNNEAGDCPTGGEEDIRLLTDGIDTPVDKSSTRTGSITQQPTRKVIFRPKRLLSKRKQQQAPPSTSTTSNHQHQPAKSSQAPQGAKMETEDTKNHPVARTLTSSWWSKRRDSRHKQWMTAAHHHHGGLVDDDDRDESSSLPPGPGAASKQNEPMVMQMVFFDRHKRKLAEGDNYY